MKSFAIFPTISIFILTFTLLRMNWEFPTKKNLIWSFLITFILGGLLIIFAIDVFILLYLSNFVFALILIPFLTFLLNDFFPETTGGKLWIRLFGMGLIATAITLTLLGTTFFLAIANNPMDPGPK